jgi:3-oxoacyl-[acyl-carrier protein] reductase
MRERVDRFNRPVLVTGAGKGIGKAIALRLGAAGYPVTVHYGRDAASAEAVAAEIIGAGGAARTLGFDIADRDACSSALEMSGDKDSAFWGVVLNAGIAKDNAFPAIEGRDWDLVLRTNLDGFYNVLHPLVMSMIRRRDGGRIVTLSSISGIMGNRGQVNYSASKAGIIGATKALAVELAKRNITVNCIAPGIIETAMTQALPEAEISAAIPMRRFGKPHEVAALAEFLLSEDASYITRQVISVNGGMC